MKTTLRAATLAASAIVGLTACDETTSVITANLCTTEVQAVAPSEDSESPASDNLGGELAVTGRNFWSYIGASDAAEDGPAAYAEPFDLRVRIGGVDAEVLAAYEQTITLSEAEQPRNLDGTVIASSCQACSSCVTANTNGCGGCDAECLACEQVVVVDAPLIPVTSGQVSADGSTLSVPVFLIGGISQSPGFYYSLPISECADAEDNDADGSTDEEDPECVSSGGGSEE